MAGGFTAADFNGTPLASAETYDPSTGGFTSTAAMYTARGSHAAAPLANGDVLVAGGRSKQCCDPTKTAEVFSLTFIDTRAPRITTPGDFVVISADPVGAAVPYIVSATDNVDDDPTVTCEPPSGSTFPIGATTVTCTATDSAGNTAVASFTVTVLVPFDLGLVLSSSGGVDTRTGVATVRGTVTCNREAHGYVSGELSQVVARRAQVDGFFFAEFDCSPPSATWVAAATPTTGRYIAGKATASASASACDAIISCDGDQGTRIVTLRGR